MTKTQIQLLIAGVVLVLAVAWSALAQRGVMMSCRDASGTTIASFETSRIGSPEGILMLNLPVGVQVQAQCSVQ